MSMQNWIYQSTDQTNQFAIRTEGGERVASHEAYNLDNWLDHYGSKQAYLTGMDIRLTQQQLVIPIVQITVEQEECKMYLATFSVTGVQTYGFLTACKTRLVDARAAESHFYEEAVLPATLVDVFGNGLAIERLQQVRRQVAETGEDAHSLPLAEVVIDAPIPNPKRNIFCLGINYREHAFEFSQTKDESKAIPKYPIVFSKATTSVIGPEQFIKSHAEITEQLDYEAELGIVIGKEGTNISKEDAYDYIFGYTIINDVTARDLQKRHQQWLLGKSLDTFCPMGPYVVTADEIPTPVSLNIQCRVNGEVRQNSNTDYLIFDIPTIIETLSAGITLKPGDIIATGTPSGVGMGFEPPRFMKAGDVVEVEIERLGVLKNTVS
jgi:2-keto-4-pentenoate hydratase/2-oxohepta-3-ene-1,7-dioic acid hydratase in catechol pathway